MASSSSSSSEIWTYEVFLSFRGEDTRKTFVDHLYSALSQNGIHTYKDDETLPRGESIAPALFEAIERSRIAVIVFSESYANSFWCLEELAHIMKCKDERGQIVIPIFYHVDPSDVRNQKRKYGEAFAEHESGNDRRVESWRKALADAGNLSGWVSKDIANGHESKVIKEIVDKILNRLFPFDSNVDEDLVGMRARLQDLKSKLDIGSGDVRMVGIWGIGGGGKTTLASSVYYEISSKFDGGCFIENIREESSKCGLEKLQQNILKHVLKNEVKIERVADGRHLIKSRLRHKNVLIVLDDVDHLDQLKALAGSHSWFGEGSRIIITTRDEHLLKAHRVNVIYSINLLNDVEASQLFCKHASSEYITIEDYDMFSKKVISYACGLPLALKVLGSFLCDKNKNEWESALARLKDTPDDDIIQILKITYDGLKEVEKELFLDIACFFRRIHKRWAMEIFDACGLHGVIGVKVLIQKALITVGRNGLFDMHDLVQEMAHYIVRGEHPNNPEKHSRVWKKEELRRLFDMASTMENHSIKALEYWEDDLWKWDDDPWRWDDDPGKLFMQSDLQAMSNMKKLHWVRWLGYPGTTLPTTFQPMELCYLDLRFSSIKQLWEGYKHLPSLKVIDLSGSTNLIKTPYISGLPCLEKMLLAYCTQLKEIHPSTGYHEGLVYLDMTQCLELEMFPPIVRMQKLETLIFSDCHRLCNFPAIQMKMDALKHLYLDGSGIEVVPSSIGDYCINLQSLDLSGNNFSRIGFSLSQLSHLKYLDLSYCSCLVELPDLPSSIAILNATSCDSLEIVGDFPTNHKWLWNVSLSETPKLGPIGVEKVVRSMLEGNAIEDYFMSIHLGSVYVLPWCCQQIGIFRLQLPQNWDNDFIGFYICFADLRYDVVKIIMEQEMHKDYQSDLLVLDETSKITCMRSMFFISFNSVRHTSWWDSIEMPSQISFFIRGHRFKVELVPRRKIEGDSIERATATTDCFEFWDHRKTFQIRHDSKFSLEIEWHK